MKFTFQVFSDLHQEFITNIFKLPPRADYLFLAGDIHNIGKNNFKPFFDYVSENWKQVFYVPGNHEYYHNSKTINELKCEYRDFFDNYTNVHYIDDGIITITIDHYVVIVIGSTLWSSVSLTNNINDFKQIKEEPGKLITKEYFNQLHDNSVTYIHKQMEMISENENVIILTHFPPVQKNTSSPIHQNVEEYIRNYFSCNIINQFKQYSHQIKCWIHGHTHYSNDFIEPETNIRVLSNQLGYIQEFTNIVNKNNIMKGDGVFEVYLK